MKVYRYTLWILLRSFFLSYITLAFILFVGVILQSFSRYPAGGVYVMVHILPYILFPFLIYLIPISFLSAVMSTVSKLKADNELVTFASFGLSPFFFYIPFFLVACLGILVVKLSVDYWIPQANWSAWQNTERALSLLPLEGGTNSGTSLHEVDLGAVKLFFERRRGRQLERVYLVSPFGRGGKEVVLADRADLIRKNQAVLVNLDNAAVTRWNDPDSKETKTLFQGKHYQFSLPYQDVAASLTRGYKELTTPELLETPIIQGLPEYQHLLAHLEFHKRNALSVTPLLFLGLGVPLGMFLKTRGFLVKLLVAFLLIALFYYPSMLFADIRAQSSSAGFSPWLAGWFPDGVVLFLVGGCMLFNRLKGVTY